MEKKSNKKNIKKENIKNGIFLGCIVVIVIIILILSASYKKDNKEEVYFFNILEFKNISPIGLSEYKAFLASDTNSITFFCSNENKECHNEIKILNDIAQKNNIYIDYINVVELTTSEKEELKEISNIFNNDFYPSLVIIKSGKIVNNSNVFLNETDILKIFSENQIIE